MKKRVRFFKNMFPNDPEKNKFPLYLPCYTHLLSVADTKANFKNIS